MLRPFSVSRSVMLHISDAPLPSRTDYWSAVQLDLSLHLFLDPFVMLKDQLSLLQPGIAVFRRRFLTDLTLVAVQISHKWREAYGKITRFISQRVLKFVTVTPWCGLWWYIISRFLSRDLARKPGVDKSRCTMSVPGSQWNCRCPATYFAGYFYFYWR